MVSKPVLKIPEFNSEQEEATWWGQVKFSDFKEVPLSEKARQRKIPPSQRKKPAPPVSIRFEPEQIHLIKELAGLKGTNYQSLIKSWVAERLFYEQQKQESPPEMQYMLENLKQNLEQNLLKLFQQSMEKQKR